MIWSNRKINSHRTSSITTLLTCGGEGDTNGVVSDLEEGLAALCEASAIRQVINNCVSRGLSASWLMITRYPSQNSERSL